MHEFYKVKPYGWNGYDYCVESFIEGRRRRRMFKTRREAVTWAQLRNIEVANSGLNALSISEEMRVQVQRSLLMLEPYGKTLEEAVRAALPIFEAERSSETVENAVKSLVAVKTAEGCSVRYLGDMRNRLDIFSRSFGKRYLSTIGTKEIKEFLLGLNGSNTSRNNMRRLLSVLFSFALEAEWCDSNPAKKIRAFGRKSLMIGILTPEEAAALLRAGCDRIKPFLAIGLFAGLRRSELQRIDASSIYWDSGTIRVDVTKTGVSRRFVKIRENLRAWLKEYYLKPISEREYQVLLNEAREAAKLKNWPHNAMRHSFCSYALAAEKQLNELVLEMGHTNANTLFAHYRELVTEQEAQAYWKIIP